MHTLKQKKRRRKIEIRKDYIVLLLFIILSGVTIYYVRIHDVSYTEPYVMHLTEGEPILCHYSDVNDALPAAEDPNFSPRPNSIFFHETSCSGGLNSRQACSIESAARVHPRREVYVLFSSPVNETVLKRSCIAKLRLFHNVRVARVNILEYAKGTPLEEMIQSKPFSRSRWWMEHTSDALRYLTLYKWGGVYLDTDMLAVKSLTTLGHNWVGKENEDMVNGAAIAISMDHLGRRLAEALINELKDSYRPDEWTHNGPEAITRVLHKFCNTNNVDDWGPEHCGGLEVYDERYFYPLYYNNKKRLFKPGNISEETNIAYTFHFWNKLTHSMKIQKGSPYWKMAEQYCPTIFKMYGDDFGN